MFDVVLRGVVVIGALELDRKFEITVAVPKLLRSFMYLVKIPSTNIFHFRCLWSNWNSFDKPYARM